MTYVLFIMSCVIGLGWGAMLSRRMRAGRELRKTAKG